MMNSYKWFWSSVFWVVVLNSIGLSCNTATSNTTIGAAQTASSTGKNPFKNNPRCDTQSNGREVSFRDLSGRGRYNMLEVIAYKRMPNGNLEGHVDCVEVDTNFDGTLDLIRKYSDQGELLSEDADRNYDGKDDVWVTYQKGIISKQVFDNSFRGVPDEFQYYREGKLRRIERDRNGDGKIDIWEFYVNGHLERMGVDQDFDGRIDMWFRDEAARAEQKRMSSAATATSASASTSSSVAP